MSNVTLSHLANCVISITASEKTFWGPEDKCWGQIGIAEAQMKVRASRLLDPTFMLGLLIELYIGAMQSHMRVRVCMFTCIIGTHNA